MPWNYIHMSQLERSIYMQLVLLSAIVLCCTEMCPWRGIVGMISDISSNMIKDKNWVNIFQVNLKDNKSLVKFISLNS